MTMPDFTPTGAGIKWDYVYNADDSVDPSGTTVDLSPYAVFPSSGLWNYIVGHAEVAIGEGRGSHFVGSNELQSGDLQLSLIAYENTGRASILLQEINNNIIAPILAANEYKWTYLRPSFWSTGSTFYPYRIYGKLTLASAQLIRRTNASLVDPLLLNFRTSDPAFFEDSVQTKSITVVNGVGSTGTFTPGGNLRTDRAHIKITADHATEDVNNVIITNADGDTCTLLGSTALDHTTNEYWKIDSIEGRVYRGTALANEVEAMDEFSGDFISLRSGINENIVISQGGARTDDFNVTATFLKRLA